MPNNFKYHQKFCKIIQNLDYSLIKSKHVFALAKENHL